MMGAVLCESVFDNVLVCSPGSRAERTGLRSKRGLSLDRRGIEDGLEGSAEEERVLSKADGKGPSPKADRMGFRSSNGGARTVVGGIDVGMPKDCVEVIGPIDDVEPKIGPSPSNDANGLRSIIGFGVETSSTLDRELVTEETGAMVTHVVATVIDACPPNNPLSIPPTLSRGPGCVIGKQDTTMLPGGPGNVDFVNVLSVLGLDCGREIGRMLNTLLGLIGGLLVVRSVGCGGTTGPPVLDALRLDASDADRAIASDADLATASDADLAIASE